MYSFRHSRVAHEAARADYTRRLSLSGTDETVLMNRSAGWTPDDARALYNIDHWGEGYFGVNAAGHLSVKPRRNGADIDLFQLVERVELEGLALPVLLRFSDILHDRVDALCDAFGAAMRETGYTGRYTAVYPIKVNQQRTVIEEILRLGN